LGTGRKGKKDVQAGRQFRRSDDRLSTKYSADALRFWSAGATLGNDLRYNERDVAGRQASDEQAVDAIRFISMYLADEPAIRAR
jgi:valyl-tRNA synthetase